MSLPPPNGIYVPAVIFFDDKGELDVLAIKSHVLRLAKGGVTGILVQGTNGEAQLLSREERKQTIRLTRDTLDQNGYNDVAVIAGTGAQSTKETIQLCYDAQTAGASHALVLTPSTWASAMNSEAIIRFHQEVASSSPIPILIYNFPKVTAGIDLDSDLLSTLATHPNIVGTKLSCGNIGKLHRLVSSSSSTATTFAVFPGKSDVLLQALLSSSPGGIVALANIVPKLHHRLFTLYNTFKNHNDNNNAIASLDEAFHIQSKLAHGDWAASKLGGIGAIKAVIVNNFGYGTTHVRSPLMPSSPSAKGPTFYNTLLEIIELERSLPDVLPKGR